MIISRTPFRISFFGGGTDYPAWIEKNGGSVLSTTINKYCHISCRYLPPFFEHKHRIVWSQIEKVVSVDEIQHPSVRECLRFLNITKGLEIHHDGDLPARAGLGSSSAFTVGMLNALYGLMGRMPDKQQLATEAIVVEQERIKESVGCQDQIATAYGGLNRIDFQSNGAFNVSQIRLPQTRLEEFQNHLMLIFTGTTRSASEIAAEQIKATSEKETELKTLQGMTTESIRLLTSGNWDEFGRLLHESWLLKRNLTDKISTESIDSIYARALKAGAWGGKLLGAGGGGFMLLFAPPDRHEKIRSSLPDFLNVPFRFETAGSQIIFYDRDRCD
jgi:D-glycero-alpha-D-manno-heptose-7-phosphate kinase